MAVVNLFLLSIAVHNLVRYVCKLKLNVQIVWFYGLVIFGAAFAMTTNILLYMYPLCSFYTEEDDKTWFTDYRW